MKSPNNLNNVIFIKLFNNYVISYKWILTTVLIPFLNNYVFEGITIIVIIYLASGSRAAKALDVTAKVIGSAAGNTFFIQLLS